MCMTTSSLPTVYNPQALERDLYKAWEDSGYFNPDVCIAEGVTDPDAPTFSIVLPPPNVTGVLHTGHAAMLAIEDTLVRFHRMRGKRTLWLPGTDHAAIATQSKVEKILKNETGKTRHDVGREEFLRMVRAFAQESHDTIVNQCRAMGASLDWSREAFTLDDARQHAVFTAFQRMYDDGLIYRGDRIVNWDPVGQTVVSDDEVLHEERPTTLYTFRYSADFPIPISTTRPETKAGDTAVAVHPDDTRYARYVGQTFTIDDFCGASLRIRVIADKDVDPSFGTGAVGVTPAHSHTDWEMSERHALERKTIIDERATMTEAAGPILHGQRTEDARHTVVQWLRDNGLMEREEDITHNVSIAERSGGIIEPLPKLQWWIDVTKEFSRHGKTVTLKSLMRDAVERGDITILPDRFRKTYFHWIDNLRDWCISRQIWYGHRVPVWYRGEEMVVSETAPEGDGWKQDDDTLDTWFSSGLWTFSTLGWPDEHSPDLRTYHPTSVLETGTDILFFWVARMILMSTYLLDEIPFRTVYLHGLVRDEHGRKMSKSLGNAINPLDVTERYGTDAVRLSLIIGGTPGQDMRLGEEKIAGFRNFTNKLWNIGRYVITQSEATDTVEVISDADHWIMERLQTVTQSVIDDIEHFHLSRAGETLREFTWNDFADWYVEVHKIEKNDGVLRTVFRTLLHLWHPFMPFVTETLFSHITSKHDARFLMVSQLTIPDTPYDAKRVEHFTMLQTLITAIRNIRATYRLDAHQRPILSCDPQLLKRLDVHRDVILRLARVSDIIPRTSQEKHCAVIATPYGEAAVLLGDVLDIQAEIQRLQAELDTLQRTIADKRSRLNSSAFVTRAPKQVVDKERAALATAEEAETAVRAALDTLTTHA